MPGWADAFASKSSAHFWQSATIWCMCSTLDILFQRCLKQWIMLFILMLTCPFDDSVKNFGGAGRVLRLWLASPKFPALVDHRLQLLPPLLVALAVSFPETIKPQLLNLRRHFAHHAWLDADMSAQIWVVHTGFVAREFFPIPAWPYHARGKFLIKHYLRLC